MMDEWGSHYSDALLIFVESNLAFCKEKVDILRLHK